MQRQGGPWAWVHRVVVDRVNPAIKRPPMNEPVDREEMRLMQERDDEPKRHQCQWMVLQRCPWPPACCPEMEHQDFVGSPDWHPCAEGPNNKIGRAHV